MHVVVVPDRDEPQSGVTFGVMFWNDTRRSLSWSEVGRLAWMFRDSFPL